MLKNDRKLPQTNQLNDVVFHTQCQRSNFTIKMKYHEKNILYVFYLRLLLKPRNILPDILKWDYNSTNILLEFNLFRLLQLYFATI